MRTTIWLPRPSRFHSPASALVDVPVIDSRGSCSTARQSTSTRPRCRSASTRWLARYEYGHSRAALLRAGIGGLSLALIALASCWQADRGIRGAWH